MRKKRKKLSDMTQSEWQSFMYAASDAMTDADWRFIQNVVRSLEKRYPALQIAIGDYGWRE
jgi:hypothetical protein